MVFPDLEKKLCLLEVWLKKEPNEEGLLGKQEEYLALSEEVDILGKKMRKTIKLLQIPDQPNVHKLQKKRDQYEREFQDIVQFVHQDPFFEQQSIALSQELQVNSLLGTPLESVKEMPEFEDSIATINYSHPGLVDAAEVSLADKEEGHGPLYPALPDVNRAALLKKKIKKAKSLSKHCDNPREQNKLKKKLEQYRRELVALGVDDDTSEDIIISHDDMTQFQRKHQREEVNPQNLTCSDNVGAGESFYNNSLSVQQSQDFQILQKKIAKIERMIQENVNDKASRKLKKKRVEYLQRLDDYEAKGYHRVSDHSMRSLSVISSMTNSSAGMSSSSMDTLPTRISPMDTSRGKTIIHENKNNEEPSQKGNQRQKPRFVTTRSLSSSPVDEAPKQPRKQLPYVILKKKLAKVNKLIDNSEDEAQIVKWQKKRLEYLDGLSAYSEVWESLGR